MSKQTVTSELRKSIEKVVGESMKGALAYSDSRKQNAVGVKFAWKQFSQPIIDQIVEDMQNKGFKLKCVKYNSTPKSENPWYNTVPGTRFTFYNKPKTKFQVGDRVEVLDGTFTVNYRGDKGVITEYDHSDGLYRVLVDERSPVGNWMTEKQITKIN
jgi:transcription antitermination factor NusG